MVAREERGSFCTQLIFAHADPSYAAQMVEGLRQRGWHVHAAHSGTEARNLARELGPATVVLDTETFGESGWLTCDKLVREQPDACVVLVAPAVTAERRRFAAFVGAAGLVDQHEGIRGLLKTIGGGRLSVAG